MAIISAQWMRRPVAAVCAWVLLALPAGTARAIVIELDDVAPDRIERQRRAAEGELPLPGTPDLARLPERLAAKGLEPGREVFIRVFKMESELELWMRQDTRFVLLDVYPICHWSGSIGPKLHEGDKQNPEGFYTVRRRQLHLFGRWRRALNVGFPNAYDRALGRTGSYILLHGGCSSVGCFAMTNGVMEEVFSLTEKALRAGQPEVSVHIFPFRMTEENLAARADSPWSDFWRNLKEGYDAFEATHVPPRIGVCGRRYGVQQVEAAEAVATGGRRRDGRPGILRRFDCSGMAALGPGEGSGGKEAEDRSRVRGSVLRRISHRPQESSAGEAGAAGPSIRGP